MNCKPGDLAICMTGFLTPEMGGRIVRVMRQGFHGEFIEGIELRTNELTWIVEIEGVSLPWRQPNGKLFMVKRRGYVDRLMRPVSGIPDTEDATTDTPIKELA